MLQGADVARVPGETSAQIQDLSARLADLKLKASDLELREHQLVQQRAAASPAQRTKIEGQLATLQHERVSNTVQILDLSNRLAEAERPRDMTQRIGQSPDIVRPEGPSVGAPQFPVTIQPPPDPGSTQQALRDLVFSDGFQIASFLLLFPFAVALARRVWVRGGRRTSAADIESSPRLQRIEQAIESIAIEVERIGEAQRFTTKLLGERAADPIAARLPQGATAPRREPGTITPH